MGQQQAYAQAPTPSPMQPQVAQGPAQPIDQQHSAIETKMSLPRPAAVAQWLMEQGDVEIQGPRSTGVIIAIAALATLCVMGVASLIAYKLRLPAQNDGAVTAPMAASARVGEEAAPVPEKGGEQFADSMSTASEGAPAAGKDSGGAKPGSSAAAGEAPGKLTINCKPACDQIVADGVSLGPSPVFNHPLSPGQHRVTCKLAGKSKTLAVMITSGQLTSKTVRMD